MNDRDSTRFVGIMHSGKIKNGQVVLSDHHDDLPEDADVIVVVAQDDGPELSPAQLAQLEASETEADRCGDARWESLRVHLFSHDELDKS